MFAEAEEAVNAVLVGRYVEDFFSGLYVFFCYNGKCYFTSGNLNLPTWQFQIAISQKKAKNKKIIFKVSWQICPEAYEKEIK